MSEEHEDRSDRRVKVTDKRMFTAEGELREEYRTVETPETEPTPAEPEPASPGRPAPPSAAAPPAAAATPPQEQPPLEVPSTGAGPQPSFFDLLGILAEPATIYLGDVELPDGGTAENLDAARLHIDLLDVLRSKTAGNLSAQESAVLEDVLYRLRMRYVQKRG